MSAPWFGGEERRKSARGENPETLVKRAIRDMLRLLRIPVMNHFGGPMSERGVSDLIGTVPGRILLPIGYESDAWALAKSIKGSEPIGVDEVAIILARRVVELEARGSAFWCEVKVPGKDAREDQEAFLAKHREAGALAFVAHDPREVVAALAAFGYQPAKAMSISIGRPPETQS